jgi:hypothetical protein
MPNVELDRFPSAGLKVTLRLSPGKVAVVLIAGRAGRFLRQLADVLVVDIAERHQFRFPGLLQGGGDRGGPAAAADDADADTLFAPITRDWEIAVIAAAPRTAFLKNSRRGIVLENIWPSLNQPEVEFTDFC